MRRGKTQEEKVASKLSEIVSDVRLDLEQVGIHLANAEPNLTLRRLNVIMETAEEEKEVIHNERYNPIFD